MKGTWLFIIGVSAIVLTGAWGHQAAAQPEWGLPDLPGEEMMGDILIDSEFLFVGPEEGMDEGMIQQEPGPGGRPPMGPMGRMPGEIPPPLMERLKLTDEQQTKLKDLRLGFAKEMVRLRADLQVARLDLGAFLDQPSPRPEEARAKAAKVSEADSAILQRMVAFRVGMKSILTPEQQKILQQVQQEQRMRFMGQGPRPGRPFGPPFMRRWRPGDGPRPEMRPER